MEYQREIKDTKEDQREVKATKEDRKCTPKRIEVM